MLDDQLKLGDVTEPGVRLGLLDLGSQVGADLVEAWSLARVDLQEAAANAGVFVDSVGAVGRRQLPRAILRWPKCSRNSSHSCWVGSRYSFVGRSWRRLVMNCV